MKYFFNCIRKYKFLYLLCLPGLAYYIIFHYMPMYGIVIAFQNYIPVKGFLHSEWVGLEHLKNMFSSIMFFRVLWNTIIISSYKILFGFPVPIILAITINEVRNKIFKNTFQTISYLPNFISWVIISGMVYAIFNTHYGVFAGLAHNLGIEYVDISKNPDYFRAFLVITTIWKTAGWNSIIYLAAITNIDPQIYESAMIDGANKWQRIMRITIPSIMPIMAIILILSVGAILREDFEQIIILSGENPSLLSVSDTFESYVFREGIRSNNFSFPAAVGIFQSFFGMWLVLGVNKISKKLGYGGIW